MSSQNTKLKDRVVSGLATWGGLGCSPYVPGTLGTLGAFPLVWVLAQAGVFVYMVITLVFIVAAIQICHLYEAKTQKHDLPEVVIDEVAGFLVAMTWVPLTWSYCLAGFILFRFFDMLKPFPISYLDREMKGGFGVVVDDIAAGLVTNIILQYWMTTL